MISLRFRELCNAGEHSKSLLYFIEQYTVKESRMSRHEGCPLYSDSVYSKGIAKSLPALQGMHNLVLCNSEHFGVVILLYHGVCCECWLFLPLEWP